MNLTPNQKRALRHLWKGELTNEEIAEEMGFTDEQLREAAAALKLPTRVETETYLPTKQEILLAAAEIRAKWTPAEREARLVGGPGGKLIEATGVDTNARRRPAADRAEGSPPDRQEG